jgi:uncharacterized membrane protein
MHTPASISRHPIHPMLVPIPIGLWIFSLVCDVIYVVVGDPVWRIVALYTMVGGIVGALAAALPGLIDLLSLPRTLKRTALIHMTINLVVVALYAFNAWLRTGGMESAAAAYTVWLSAVAIALLLVSGWLGGKMVYEAGVGVEAAPPPRGSDQPV